MNKVEKISRLCMKEISRALIEMISEDSPYASKDMLCELAFFERKGAGNG